MVNPKVHFLGLAPVLVPATVTVIVIVIGIVVVTGMMGGAVREVVVVEALADMEEEGMEVVDRP